jgi:phosphatidylethanolamine-binding protein (PEBP) family uncharacterized protein
MCCLCTFSNASAADLIISHIDPAWKDGKADVPLIGICLSRNVGGKGMSPPMKVTGIPNGTVKLELHFTDEDWKSKGAHGVIGYKITAGSTSVVIPSFKGETDKLPPNFEKISAHAGRQDGAYLAPCSGGQMHDYTVYVYAKNADDKELANGKLPLGNY